LAGATDRDIRTAITAHFPDADAQSLIVNVLKDLEKKSDTSPDLALGWCIEATREMYRRMVEIGDFPGALRAVKQMAELSKVIRDKADMKDMD
jgi:hypothetical protein